MEIPTNIVLAVFGSAMPLLGLVPYIVDILGLTREAFPHKNIKKTSFKVSAFLLPYLYLDARVRYVYANIIYIR